MGDVVIHRVGTLEAEYIAMDISAVVRWLQEMADMDGRGNHHWERPVFHYPS